MSVAIERAIRRHGEVSMVDSGPSASPEKPDYFPDTMSTWIGRKMEGDDRDWKELTHHIMLAYRRSLVIYCQGCRDSWVGEAEELVQEFFASRLARQEYMINWRESGKPLRLWLRNGFILFLKEKRRERRKQDRFEELPGDGVQVPAGDDVDPVLAYDRSCAQDRIGEVIQRLEELCEEKGLSVHWQVFKLHDLEGMPLKDVVERLGIKAGTGRAAVMARTARNKVPQVLNDVIGKHLLRPEDVRKEIESLWEILRS